MHPTDPADPAPIPPATRFADGPPVVEVVSRATSSARHDAAVALERLAVDLDSIADRWGASRTATAGELAEVRAALVAAQAALAVLAEAR